MRDGLRLSTGTLTALPVRAPSRVTPDVARVAVLLAPLAVAPLALLVAVVLTMGPRAGLSDLAVAVVAVATLALGTRCLHWDGLSDVADGLTASYDPARSLAVMRTGTAGPAGVVAVVLVGLLQVAGLTQLLDRQHGALLAALAVCGARCGLALTCLVGVPAARRDGLGLPFAQTVSRPAAALMWLLLVSALSVAELWAGEPWWRGAVAAVAAGAVVMTLVRRAAVRLGGVTGDVFGAAIELSTAVLWVLL